LRTNRISHPLGIDAFPVEFSWQMAAKPGTFNVTQTSYKLQVSDSLSFESDSILWDSKKTATSKSSSLTAIYAGNDVKWRTRYYWRIRI